MTSTTTTLEETSLDRRNTPAPSIIEDDHNHTDNYEDDFKKKDDMSKISGQKSLKHYFYQPINIPTLYYMMIFI